MIQFNRFELTQSALSESNIPVPDFALQAADSIESAPLCHDEMARTTLPLAV
jgi:hypothetical protein